MQPELNHSQIICLFRVKQLWQILAKRKFLIIHDTEFISCGIICCRHYFVIKKVHSRLMCNLSLQQIIVFKRWFLSNSRIRKQNIGALILFAKGKAQGYTVVYNPQSVRCFIPSSCQKKQRTVWHYHRHNHNMRSGITGIPYQC